VFRIRFRALYERLQFVLTIPSRTPRSV